MTEGGEKRLDPLSGRWSEGADAPTEDPSSSLPKFESGILNGGGTTFGCKVRLGSITVLLAFLSDPFAEDVSEAARVEGPGADASMVLSIEVRWPPTNEVS